MDDATLARLREEFPVARHWAYLNHAAVAPLPRRAVDRVASTALDVSAHGDRHWPERNAEAERVRGLATRLLGAREPREVAFVENTSGALSIVAEALPWQAGDNVVGALCEFPSNVYPWMRLADRGVELRMVPERDGGLDLDELAGTLDERTRVLALSWVQYASGYRADLARLGRLCRERGVLFVVDVIQGLGALALDVERDMVDVAAGSAHKWLLGPEGIGLLWISERVVDRLRPLRSGWRSVRDMLDWTTFDPTPAAGARRFESGTLNVLGIRALGGALEILLEAGPEAIERRVLALADRAAAGLAERGLEVIGRRRPEERSGIVAAVDPRRPAEEHFERLLARGVVVACRAGRLRVSPHFYNTEEEIERLLDGVAG